MTDRQTHRQPAKQTASQTDSQTKTANCSFSCSTSRLVSVTTNKDHTFERQRNKVYISSNRYLLALEFGEGVLLGCDDALQLFDALERQLPDYDVFRSFFG